MTMQRSCFKNRVTFFILAIITVAAGRQADKVDGNLVHFYHNGTWSWFEDERIVVDTAGGTILVGQSANRYGVGGSPVDGDITVTIFDLKSRQGRTSTIKENFTSYGGGDDHNSPGLLVRPDGKYLAICAGHNNDYSSYYYIYDGNKWSAEKKFDWNAIPGGADFQTTYSNLFYLSAEKRTYNIARSDARSPNLMVSSDQGATWTFGGRLTQPDKNVGYVNGYFKYSANGVDRIDFICTEHHPRDFNTSIFHGYIKNGKSFDSEGKELDNDISDKSAPQPNHFTTVFKANTVVQGEKMTHCWTIDLQKYGDTAVAAAFKARVNDDVENHWFFYGWCSGGKWTTHFLCKAGPRLYDHEADYTGLIALDPNDPTVLYLATPIDPRDGGKLKNHEIFKGKTNDHGASWTWTPVTENSNYDNYRPIIPDWDKNNTAIAWMRGTYVTSQNYDMAVVGLLKCSGETVGKKVFHDATADNTKQSDGSALGATGPSSGSGAADGKWHWRTGVGNGGSVLASAESGGENAPALRTTVNGLSAGTYDVWVNFWADPAADWRIQAGLSESGMQLFRLRSCRQVDKESYTTSITQSGSGNAFLYQGYLGRAEAAAGGKIDVYVDDYAVQVATASTLIGDKARTWYDGIGFAPVNQSTAALPGNPSNAAVAAISSFSSGGIELEVAEPGRYTLSVFTLDGRLLGSPYSETLPKGRHLVSGQTPGVSGGLYCVRLEWGERPGRIAAQRLFMRIRY